MAESCVIDTLKPMLKVSEMIAHLKEKNVKFKECSEEEAIRYLRENNNYFNVTSYKSNFTKYQCGELKDQYIDLDFAYLQDLASIDYQTRLILFKMTINIEHYLKMRILNSVEKIDVEDGYKIVNLYLDNDYNDEQFPKRLHDNIMRRKSSIYLKNIFLKYNIQEDSKIENVPIWEFLELLTFGELVRFFSFFTKYYHLNML